MTYGFANPLVLCVDQPGEAYNPEVGTAREPAGALWRYEGVVVELPRATGVYWVFRASNPRLWGRRKRKVQ